MIYNEGHYFCLNRQRLESVYITGLTILTLEELSYRIYIFTHLKLCLATAKHNFKWVKIILFV